MPHVVSGCVVDFGDVHVPGSGAPVAAVVGDVAEESGARLLFADLAADPDRVTRWQLRRLRPGHLGRWWRHADCHRTGWGRREISQVKTVSFHISAKLTCNNDFDDGRVQ